MRRLNDHDIAGPSRNTAEEHKRNKQRKPIVKRLQSLDIPDFDNFRCQHISEWRDQTVRDKFVWKKEVLAGIKKGNKPGGHTTRVGVLVSDCCC